MATWPTVGQDPWDVDLKAYIDDLVADTVADIVAADVTSTATSWIAATNVDTAIAEIGSEAATKVGVETLTNKRVTKRSSIAATATTLTMDVDSFDFYGLTALASALTIANPTGTPVVGDELWLRVKDNGTTRLFTFGSQFRGISSALPAGTVTINKTTYMRFVWHATDSKWDMVLNVREP